MQYRKLQKNSNKQIITWTQTKLCFIIRNHQIPSIIFFCLLLTATSAGIVVHYSRFWCWLRNSQPMTNLVLPNLEKWWSLMCQIKIIKIIINTLSSSFCWSAVHTARVIFSVGCDFSVPSADILSVGFVVFFVFFLVVFAIFGFSPEKWCNSRRWGSHDAPLMARKAYCCQLCIMTL